MAALLLAVLGAYAVVCVAVDLAQRELLYHPSHRAGQTQLEPWTEGGEVVGFCRRVPAPRRVWLMTHGNTGQASQRDYVLSRMDPGDSLFVLEYPGFGDRRGAPSRDSMNRAAAGAYGALRREYPALPLGLIGESIGSGPACFLASMSRPPDRIVLIVPFDTLESVASGHLPFLPVGAMLRDDWDNLRALRGYAGPVEIYGARDDRVIPVAHARNLAAHVQGAAYVEIEGGHNDWAASGRVRIR
jgi:pimeloyl-ACP methyl ester carboxylesterase